MPDALCREDQDYSVPIFWVAVGTECIMQHSVACMLRIVEAKHVNVYNSKSTERQGGHEGAPFPMCNQ